MNKLIASGLFAAAVTMTQVGFADTGKGASIEERVRALEEELAELRAVTERQGPPRDNAFTAFWKDGLKFETAEKDFALAINGRIMADYWWIDDNARGIDLTGIDSGVGFRRARLEMGGTIYRDVIYKAVYDFADGKFKDVLVGLKNVPFVQKVMAGHYKVPMSLEEQTSSKYITFMERSAVVNAFSPGRRMGGGIEMEEIFGVENTTFSAMVYRPGAEIEFNKNFVGEGDYAFGARGTWAYVQDKTHLFHLGGSVAYENLSQRGTKTEVQFRARPGIGFIKNRPADTGKLAADDVLRFGAEAAWVHGPFSLQGEFMAALTNDASGTLPADALHDGHHWGSYVQASYFLTGESRPYKKGKFGRVTPKKNFSLSEGTWGAFEIAQRFEYLDLDVDNVVDTGNTVRRGGEMYGLTSGLNWYLNPNTRVMVNYSYYNLDDRSDRNVGSANRDHADMHVLGTRFQIDF